MNTLYDVISEEAKEAVALLIGCTPGPGMNNNLREIPALPDGFTIGEAKNAYLNFLAPRVIEIEVRNVFGNFTIYPANENAELIAAIAGTKTLTNAALAYAERLGFTIREVTKAKTKFGTK